jgi:inhibitor of KinA
VPPPILKPIGDSGILAYLQDEPAALRFAGAVRTAGFAWLVDVVPTYMSVGVFFDPDAANLQSVRATLKSIKASNTVATEGRSHVIPCCYEMGLDLHRVAQLTGLTSEQIIERHTAQPYAVHAIGFCPGFPYLGYLPYELTGVPRLPSPRIRVEPGSVGLTGRQTGLYPLARPGGWNLIGCTPLEMVNVEDNYFPLRVGDRIRFKRIDEAEYEILKGERLAG